MPDAIGPKRGKDGGLGWDGSPETTGWRPIDSYNPDWHADRVLIAGRYTNGIKYVEEAYYRRHPPHSGAGAHWCRRYEPPTHWQPLPEPPEYADE